MSLISDLCRLCLVDCRSVGIPVYPNDPRRDKIRDCLSIIIEDDSRFPLIICNDCDNKLTCFHQFRMVSMRSQHEFANIMKSLQPLHYENNRVEYHSSEIEEPIKGIEEIMYVNFENIYSQTAPTTETPLQSSHSYDNQCSYIEHDLHLALDDDNQADNQTIESIPSNQMYQTVQRPHISPLSPATTPILLVQQPQITPQLNCYADTPSYIEPIPNNFETVSEENENHYTEASAAVEMASNDFPQNENDSFTYDDFDDSCQSIPERNNVENAIDKKIEEFTQNKRNQKRNPKICTVCNKLFRTNYKLRVHMETHAENNAKFICKFHHCNKAFKSKIGLQEHSAKHTGQFNFTCETCQKQFVIRSYFVAHQRIHSTSNPKTFCCTLCPKTFKSKQNLVDHENGHLGLKYFKCEHCEKSFTTKTHLDVHAKSHNQLDMFLCTVCNKPYKSKSYLKVHMKTHNDALKNHECEFCGKKFIQLSDLKIHSRIHTNERNFVCETCGKAFSRKDSLELHTRTHNSEKSFRCECGKAFSRKTFLMNHGKKCDIFKIKRE